MEHNHGAQKSAAKGDWDQRKQRKESFFCEKAKLREGEKKTWTV
jgi:hypothetical protein